MATVEDITPKWRRTAPIPPGWYIQMARNGQSLVMDFISLGEAMTRQEWIDSGEKLPDPSRQNGIMWFGPIPWPF